MNLWEVKFPNIHLRFADGMNYNIYFGNGEIVAGGRMVRWYIRMLPQPMFEGANINAVGHGHFFHQPRARVYPTIIGLHIVGSSFMIE